MKYDPDVPMTKEEATVWRREQRRKRNRESAAASRQRQRDRIQELEEEVSSSQASHRISLRQDSRPRRRKCSSTLSITCSTVTAAPITSLKNNKSAWKRPNRSTVSSSFCASPTTSTFLDFTGSEEKKVQQQQPKPIKMISRHA